MKTKPCFLLTVEFPSIVKHYRVVNRITFKVVFAIPDHYGFIPLIKMVGKKIYANPNMTYEAFQRQIKDHYREEMINFIWSRRPPMIQDVINFEWQIEERESAKTSAV